MDIKEIAVENIKAYAKNAKKHDERQIKNVMQSIKNYGIVQPLVVDKDNVLIIGHCRLIACKRLKMDKVPVVKMDELTQEQVDKLRLLDNKLNESEWDLDLLAEDVPTLDFSDFDIDWGLPEDIEENTEIEEDEAPEPPTEPKAKLGDLYILGKHRLVCGDSTDIAVIDRLMNGEKADMVFTDPPYSIGNAGGGIVGKSNSMKQIKQNGVDSFDPSRLTMWSETNIFCHNKPLIKAYIELAENNNMPYDLAFYKKKNTVPNYKGHLMTDVEYIAIIGKQDPNKGLEKEMYSKCFIGQKDNGNELSYSKPVALCAKYIQLYSKQSVLDFFGGSGSTLIACEQLNRKCYMCELDPKYVSVIVNRWLNLTGRKDEIFCIRDGQKLTYDEVFN